MSARGAQRDRAVRDWLAEHDWLAVSRAARSHGCADVVAIVLGQSPAGDSGQVRRRGGPYERFGPRARARLAFAARLGGGDALLAWWPPRGALRWIPESEWPS